MEVQGVTADYDDPETPDEWELGDVPGMTFRVRAWDKDPGNNGSVSYDLTHCNVAEALDWARNLIDSQVEQGGYLPTLQVGSVQVGVYLGSKGDEILWLYGGNEFLDKSYAGKWIK